MVEWVRWVVEFGVLERRYFLNFLGEVGLGLGGMGIGVDVFKMINFRFFRIFWVGSFC